MRWALVAGLAIAVVACGAGRPAEALPAASEGAALSRSAAAPLLTVRYGRHHRHYRHSWPAAAEDGTVKPGQWEFNSQLQNGPIVPPAAGTPALAAPPPGAPLQTSRTACIASDNAVPAEFGPQCKLDSKQRQGSRISWSMSCANTGVRSEGEAQYRGDAMEATMVSHLPGPNGSTHDLTQRITGRYIGPCPQSAQTRPAQAQPQAAQMIAAQAAAQAPSPGSSGDTPASGSSREWVEPAAAAPPASAAAEQKAPAEREAASEPRRSGQHRTHHARSRHAHWWHHRRWYGGGVSYRARFGPAPYSSGGP